MAKSSRLIVDIQKNVGVTCKSEGCEREATRRGLCHKHHQWLWNHGLLDPTPKLTIAEMLDKYSEPVPECGCVLWTGSWNNKFYGVLGKKNGMNYAHRVSYEVHKGPIPEGLVIMHKCDTPACINPDHLSVGTFKENMEEMSRKERHRYGVNAPGRYKQVHKK